jgi:membrane protease YdiL (CAAX protease family)
MLRWGAAAYFVTGVLSAAIAWLWRNGSPFEHPEPWLVLPAEVRHVYSFLLGTTFGALVAVLTRIAVQHFKWAQKLHREFRPIARSLSAFGILVLALFSAIGEELLFRGLLQPFVGLWLSAAFFGFVHQMPGPSRWVWVTWATVVGLALGLIFQLTGSLAGCIAAHALINAVNLIYLKSHDPEPQRRALGGLLGQRS